MTHISYIEAVRQIANNGWGRECKSIDEAQRNLLGEPQKLAAFAAVELVGRFAKFCQIMGGDPKPPTRLIANRPEDATKHGVGVGGYLYTYDMESGLAAYIVVAVDADGYEIVASCDPRDYYQESSNVFFAGSWLHATKQDAMRQTIKDDLEYHGRRERFAREAIEALEANGDLTKFVGGVDS